MTIGTAPFSTEATWREIDAIIAFLDSLGIKQVAVTYGWGCKADGIDQPVTLPLTALTDFLHNNIAQGIYHLGEDNLYIGASEPALTFTLCHDADIHFESVDKSLEARLRYEWEGRGYRVWPKTVKGK